MVTAGPSLPRTAPYLSPQLLQLGVLLCEQGTGKADGLLQGRLLFISVSSVLGLSKNQRVKQVHTSARAVGQQAAVPEQT